MIMINRCKKLKLCHCYCTEAINFYDDEGMLYWWMHWHPWKLIIQKEVAWLICGIEFDAAFEDFLVYLEPSIVVLIAFSDQA